MAIGGDPGELRAQAQRVRGWADQVGDVAGDQLEATSVDWASNAAETFRLELETRRHEVLRLVERYQEAATRLDALADALEERQQVLTGLLAAAGRTFDDLTSAVADGAGEVMDVAHRFVSDTAELGRDVLDRVGLR